MSDLLNLPFTDINLTGGNLVFVGSRPGMGRTQYLLQLIFNNHEFHKCICYFPFQRKTIIENRFQENELNKFAKIIANHDCILNSIELKETILKDVNNFSPTYIIIDGLEKIAIPSNQNSLFNDLVRELYLLTEIIKIPIICTAYLSYELEEKFGNKYPCLNDFNSSAIEIFADMVLGLHRPFYYGYEENESGTNVINQASLFTLKNSAGPKARYDFLYNEENNFFYQ